jgi:flagellar basal-body rod protein FlgB
MALSFDKALGIHPQALELRVQRAELMANNLANADTPGFKARDIDFRAVMAQQLGNASDGELAMSTTNGRHVDAGAQASDANVLYRNPLQPSVDGNTVDTQQELAEFSKNVLDYQASFQFLNGKFKSLTQAIKGE